MFGLGLQCIWRRACLQTAVGQSLSLLSGAGPGRWQEVMTDTGSPEGVSSQLSHWLDRSGLLTDLGTVGAVHPGEGPKARIRFGLHPLGSPGLLG